MSPQPQQQQQQQRYQPHQQPDISAAQALAVFDLSEGFTAEELKSRYRSIALRVHPDHGGRADLFNTVNDCFRVLTEHVRHRGSHAEITAELRRAESMRQLESPLAHPQQQQHPSAADGKDTRGVKFAKEVDHMEFYKRGDTRSFDVGRFNERFEESRKFDAVTDTGYGDWLTAAAAAAPAEPEIKAVAPGADSDAFNRAFESSVPDVPDDMMAIIVHPTAANDSALGFAELDCDGVDDYSLSASGLSASDCKRAFSCQRLSSAAWSREQRDVASPGAVGASRQAELNQAYSDGARDVSRRGELNEGRLDSARQWMSASGRR